jgi:hypothetical protein
MYQLEDGSVVPAPDTDIFLPFMDEPLSLDPTIEAALINAGETFTDIGRGIRNLDADTQEQLQLQREGQQSNRALEGLRGEFPIASAIGQALPSLATAPISGASMLGSLGVQAGLGAVEGLLTHDPSDTSQFDNLALGAAAGVVGDIGGRMAGRVLSGVKGLVQDFTSSIKPNAANPVAAAFEAKGGRTLASQRMDQTGAGVDAVRNMESGAQSSLFTPKVFRETIENNRQLYNQTALNAIGGIDADDLGPDVLGLATDQLSDTFSDISSQVANQTPFAVGGDLAERIAGTKGQIPDLIKRGRFKGLESGVLSGEEWSVARRALAQDAADNAARGRYELADDIFADVEALDRLIEDRLGPDLLTDFARAREQYRVLEILQKPGVIKDGDVSIKVLNNRLQGKQGFGKTARLGRQTNNAESMELIDIARLGADRSLQPAADSGTAGRLALRDLVGSAATGDAFGLVSQLAAPAAVGVSEAGGGRAVSGLVNPAPAVSGQLGGAAGRGFLDEALYPFIGSQDDRPAAP